MKHDFDDYTCLYLTHGGQRSLKFPALQSAKYVRVSVLRNKVLLKHTYIVWLHTGYVCFCTTKAE